MFARQSYNDIDDFFGGRPFGIVVDDNCYNDIQGPYRTVGSRRNPARQEQQHFLELEERRRRQQRHQEMLRQQRPENDRRWKRQQQREQQQRRPISYHDEDEDGDYEIDLVRGSDGDLYYVRRSVGRQQQRQPQRRLRSGTITEEFPRRQNYDLNEDESNGEDSNAAFSSVALSESSSDNEGESSERDTTTENAAAWATARSANSSSATTTATTTDFAAPHNRQRHRKRITVTVEDASDSECESEFDSPWRNRRPSTGQWMEPVESYHTGR